MEFKWWSSINCRSKYYVKLVFFILTLQRGFRRKVSKEIEGINTNICFCSCAGSTSQSGFCFGGESGFRFHIRSKCFSGCPRVASGSRLFSTSQSGYFSTDHFGYGGIGALGSIVNATSAVSGPSLIRHALIMIPIYFCSFPCPL